MRGGFLAGIELQAGLFGFATPLTLEGNVNARLGYILGERFLLYGEAGVGALYTLSAPPAVLFWTAGGGVEVALGNSRSIFVEGKTFRPFGAGLPGIIVQGGVNWLR